MAIFRGEGGSGDATTDAYASLVSQNAQTASTKASEAAASAAAAATSETNAAASESSASSDATAAASSASNAATSETNAASSATSAASSASAASTSETNAGTSETNAASSASAASTSETNAATSASNASTSETNAASSASSASTSATNAATSATAAQTAQTAAEAAQTAAEAAQEAIDGFFLGAQASNPTVDLNGNAVTAGDWYFNTGDNTTRIYDGSSWNTVNPDLIGDATPQLGGNLDFNGNIATSFASTGIDDNATETALTIDANEHVQLTKQYAHLEWLGEGTRLNRLGSTSGPTGGAFIQNYTDGSGAHFWNSGAVSIHSGNEDKVGAEFQIDTSGIVQVGQFSGTDFRVDVDTLAVDASEDRVGINTLTPSTELHVKGVSAGDLATLTIESTATNLVKGTSTIKLLSQALDYSDQEFEIAAVPGGATSGGKFISYTSGGSTSGVGSFVFVSRANGGTGSATTLASITPDGIEAPTFKASQTATTTALSITDSGQVTTGENLIVTGDETVGGDLTVSGNLTSTGIDDNATSTQLTIGIDDAQFFNPVLPLSVGLTVGANTSIRGNLDCDGFTSTGIDDNATSTAITIDSSQNVSLSGDLTVDTDTLYVDSTNNRVGIREAAPDKELVVRGSTQQISRFSTSSGTRGYITFADANTTTENNQGIGVVGNDVKIWAGNAEVVTVDDTGNVGIGVPSPTNGKLCVDGSINITTTSGTYVAGALGYTDSNWGFLHRPPRVGAIGAHAFQSFAGSTLMTVTDGGNVGIGETQPDAPLHVNTGDRDLAIFQHGDGGSARVSFPTNSGETHIESSGGDFSVFTGGTANTPFSSTVEAITIKPNGNFGIGETNPSYPLTVASNDSGFTAMLKADTSAGNFGTLAFRQEDGTTENGKIVWNNSAVDLRANGSTALTFSTSGANERMRIDSNGNLLVGKTQAGFAVAGCRIQQTGDVRISKTGAASDTMIGFYKNGSATAVGTITSTSTATAYNTTSDYRLKENVVDLDNGIDRLKQIPVHRFNFIADPDTTVDGFIAHEVQDVVPEAISGAKDAVNDEGNPEYQGIDQSKLVPLLTAALQEAVTRIETLEAEVAALKGA